MASGTARVDGRTSLARPHPNRPWGARARRLSSYISDHESDGGPPAAGRGPRMVAGPWSLEVWGPVPFPAVRGVLREIAKGRYRFVPKPALANFRALSTTKKHPKPLD